MKYVMFACVFLLLAVSASAGSRGSITVCTTVVDHEGAIVALSSPISLSFPEVTPFDTEKHPKQGSVSGTRTIGAYSSDLLSNDGIADAYCVRESNLPFGGYFYGQPASDSEAVDEILINDQHTMLVNELSDYQPFEPRIFDSDPDNDAGDSNYDGHIVLYEESRHRVLAVLIRLKEPGNGDDDGNETDDDDNGDDGDDNGDDGDDNGDGGDDGDDNGDDGEDDDNGDGDGNQTDDGNGLAGDLEDTDTDRFTLKAFPETECVAPGEEFTMYTSVKYRSGRLRDVQVKLFVEELSEYATSSEFSLRDEPQYRPLSVRIPRSADTGWYNARVTADAHDQERIAEWRSFLVSDSC